MIDRGIGLEAAVQFARAGAHLVLVARKQETLDESKAAVLAAKPGAQVLTFTADVADAARAREAVDVRSVLPPDLLHSPYVTEIVWVPSAPRASGCS